MDLSGGSLEQGSLPLLPSYTENAIDVNSRPHFEAAKLATRNLIMSRSFYVDSLMMMGKMPDSSSTHRFAPGTGGEIGRAVSSSHGSRRDQPWNLHPRSPSFAQTYSRAHVDRQPAIPGKTWSAINKEGPK